MPIIDSEINLKDLLGPGFTDRLAWQWVKIIGRKNIVSKVEKGEPIVVSREFIYNEFDRCRELGFVTKEFSNLLIFHYTQWALENYRITGLIAERIHNECMLLIAKYHLLKWEPRKHRNPSNGIFNMFNRIRAQSQSQYLNIDCGKKRLYYEKQRRDETELINDEFSHVYGADLLLDWDCFFIETPEDILMSIERMQFEDSEVEAW